jgi:hypothetical protein
MPPLGYSDTDLPARGSRGSLNRMSLSQNQCSFTVARPTKTFVRAATQVHVS